MAILRLPIFPELPLLHPPTLVLGSTNSPSGYPSYGPVVYVSLSSSIITTQQHGQRDSKEAGRQLSSFTNLGGSANEILKIYNY